MTRAEREVLVRKVQRARRLMDVSRGLQDATDGCLAEAHRLVDEVKDIRAGRRSLPGLTTPRLWH